MLSRLQTLRPTIKNNLFRGKLVSNSNNNLLSTTQNVVCKRWSGHNAMEIMPTNYGLKYFKDLLHFYSILAGIPMLVLSAIAGIRANPELTEIPEGYEPRHWEYFKHPITRWLAKHCFHPQELDHELFLSYYETEAEGVILQTIERKVFKTMEFYADHRSQNFRPVYGEYFRAGRDELMYRSTMGGMNESRMYEAAYDPNVPAVPVEGYVPAPLPDKSE